MSDIIKCVTNPNCKIVMDCDKKIDCTTAIEQAEGLARYICGLIPCAYSNDPLAQFDNIVKDIRDRQDNAMAMEFTQVIDAMLRENGVTPKITEYKQNYEKGNTFGCKYGVCIESLDFTEHDKVFEDKIASLEENVGYYKDSLSRTEKNCDKLYHENKALKNRIAELEKKETEPINDSAPSMEWYENRHQSDCIETNRLNTTIDVLIHKVEYLRQFAGLE